MATAVVASGMAVVAPPSSAIDALASAQSYAGFTSKGDLQAEGRTIVAGKELAVTDGSAPAGSGTTYYVDSIGGDDTAAGTTAGTAWKTFQNVNAKVFAAGDRILLKAGSSWSAEGTEVAKEAYDYTHWVNGVPTDVTAENPSWLLAPKGSGTAESPIVLSSYGSGAAPELNGRGVVNDVLQLNNQQHWDISNLEITNVTDGFNPSVFEPGANQGQKPGEENPKTGDLRGIHVQAENAGTLSGFDIHNVFVHDVSGVMWSIGNTGLDRSKRTGGILFEGLKGDATAVSQFKDVTVRDNVIANTAFANVAFKQFSGMGENRYRDVKPGWGDRSSGRAATDGTITEDPDWRPHSSITVTGNYLTNRDTEYGWNSLYLTSVQGATVDNNLIDGTGVSGIEMYYADNIVVQNNEVAGVEMRVNAADSNAIDPDRGTSNVLIQGNYVHNSGEGILLCGFSFSTAVVRYNIIQDVDKNYINPHGDSGVNLIYNNLMYNTQKPTRNNTVGFFESSGSASTYLVEKNPHYVFNNAFINTRADVSGAAFRTEFPGVHFSNNAYYGPKVTAPSVDKNATTSDPKLGGDPAENIMNARLTTAQSPLISAGMNVDLAAIAKGFNATGNTATSQLPLTVDFFGTTVASPPNVGPSSYLPPEGQGMVSGIVTDSAGLAVPGATVAYGPGTVTADARGRYALEVPAGEYTLVPSAPGYENGAPVTMTIGSREILSRNLALGATTATEGTVAGTVTSSRAGLGGVAVTISKDGQTVATATTNTAGAFQIANVPMGEGYTVSATKSGYQEASQANVTVQPARTVTVNLVLSLIPGETKYVINETFDDETTGAFTQTTDGALTAKTAPAVGTITVRDDAGRAGNKYLDITKSSASSAVLAVHNTVEQNLTGAVTLEARVQRTTTNGAPNQLAMYSFTESSWNATSPASSTNPSATFGFASGKIITHNVTGSSSVKNVADYTPGKWYTIRNVVDLNTGTFDFYIDDMTTPVLADQPLRTKVDDLDYFTFFINGTNVGNMLVDYFRVNTGTPFDYNDASLASVDAKTADGSIQLATSQDGQSYTGTVDPYTQTVSLGAAAASKFAKVAINGTDVTGGNTVDVALNAGSQDDAEIVTAVPVTVMAEDGTTATYTVNISRTNPNQSTHLRNLEVESYALTPAFAPERQGADLPYQVVEELESTVSTVKVKWQAGWAGQQVQVNGNIMPEGATETTVNLKDGENIIDVTASSYPGDFGSYIIKLTRKAAVQPWELRGFTAPVDMGGVWNSVKGGSTVPLKFEMFDRGVEITDPAQVKSFTATQVQCPGTSAPIDAVEFLTTGRTQLTYEDGQFMQRWQTPKKAGSCLQVTLTAADGSQITSNFLIK
ncbi:PxKF domain-containing protein [Pseudarthrobacter sp. NamE2]|uniref:PxKF domain-containing protein n=1 Tax=Pseudarthrobacter sp. NamE2 TaxID=2576838 RepID=UPI0014852B40|nr:PxKF domain-containing protein [Pseudarthrobacter sp. NamE2]